MRRLAIIAGVGALVVTVWSCTESSNQPGRVSQPDYEAGDRAVQYAPQQDWQMPTGPRITEDQYKNAGERMVMSNDLPPWNDVPYKAPGATCTDPAGWQYMYSEWKGPDGYECLVDVSRCGQRAVGGIACCVHLNAPEDCKGWTPQDDP